MPGKAFTGEERLGKHCKLRYHNYEKVSR